jgi:hypothetical protein
LKVDGFFFLQSSICNLQLKRGYAMQQQRGSERIEMLSPSGDEKIVLFDLSKGGACCLYEKIKPTGSLLTVTVNNLTLRAKVAYSQERKDGARLGVQFLDVTPAQQKDLDDLVEKFSRGVPLSCTVADELAHKKA